MKSSLVILVGIFILLLIPYLYKTLPLKKIQLSDLPTEGDTLSLRSGNLYYLWHRPETTKSNGESIVLVHGFSTPSFVWGGLIEDFLNKGYKVLVYDHFGRGYSDRPKRKYTKEFYVETLKGLLDSQNLTDPVHLVGYSMGGPIIGYFADNFPNRTKTLSFIAPAGLTKNSSSIYSFLTKPIIGEWIWHLFGYRLLKPETQRSDDPRSINEEEFQKNFKKQIIFSGFIESLLSTIRNFNIFDA